METSKCGARDRLSNLPDSLIYHIFGFLPMNDVVPTMVLSKRWINLWTTTPCLTFDDTEMCSCTSTDTFRSFVYRVLMSWKGSMIAKFVIVFFSRHDKSLYSDLDMWVRFAVGKGVEHLQVDLKTPDEEKGTYWAPPQCLYSCSSLDTLHITGSNLRINGNADVEWHHLKKLFIEGVGQTQRVIKQVLAGSPKLERFELLHTESYESLSIQSSSLRYLLLEKYMWSDEDIPSLDSELRICAPNLETLKLYGIPYRKCLLMNVSSLTNVALRFCTDKYDMFDGNGFLRETLPQIIPAIHHVEQLKLSECCIMALGSMEMQKYMLPNVKLLKLNSYGYQEYEQIVRLLAIVPKLEMLVLQPGNDSHRLVANAESKRLEVTNLPYSSLQQLSRVKITWTDAGDDSIFPFIEMLLKCASNLQKLEFRVGQLPNIPSLMAAQTKLLRMPRSSPTAQLICYHQC